MNIFCTRDLRHYTIDKVNVTLTLTYNFQMGLILYENKTNANIIIKNLNIFL